MAFNLFGGSNFADRALAAGSLARALQSGYYGAGNAERDLQDAAFSGADPRETQGVLGQIWGGEQAAQRDNWQAQQNAQERALKQWMAQMRQRALAQQQAQAQALKQWSKQGDWAQQSAQREAEGGWKGQDFGLRREEMAGRREDTAAQRDLTKTLTTGGWGEAARRQQADLEAKARMQQTSIAGQKELQTEQQGFQGEQNKAKMAHEAAIQDAKNRLQAAQFDREMTWKQYYGQGMLDTEQAKLALQEKLKAQELAQQHLQFLSSQTQQADQFGQTLGLKEKGLAQTAEQAALDRASKEKQTGETNATSVKVAETRASSERDASRVQLRGQDALSRWLTQDPGMVMGGPEIPASAARQSPEHPTAKMLIPKVEELYPGDVPAQNKALGALLQVIKKGGEKTDWQKEYQKMQKERESYTAPVEEKQNPSMWRNPVQSWFGEPEPTMWDNPVQGWLSRLFGG